MGSNKSDDRQSKRANLILHNFSAYCRCRLNRVMAGLNSRILKLFELSLWKLNMDNLDCKLGWSLTLYCTMRKAGQMTEKSCVWKIVKKSITGVEIAWVELKLKKPVDLINFRKFHYPERLHRRWWRMLEMMVTNSRCWWPIYDNSLSMRNAPTSEKK